jgi:hypothetical protein
VSVTALHNHFFYDVPKVYFMHLEGMGDAATLARGVRAVWDVIREVRRLQPQPANRFSPTAPQPGLPTAAPITTALGIAPEPSGAVLKYVFARSGRMHGIPIGGPMGLTTWIAFTGTDALSAACGDVIMTAEEVQPVLRALRAKGFHVVALHNHMIGGDPGFFFTHFWATGPARDLATQFKDALAAEMMVPGKNRAGMMH